MIDLHTHLYFEAFDADREAVIARAREAGVRQMIVVGCDLAECRQAIALAREYEGLYASVGVHPNEFREESRITNSPSEIPETGLTKVSISPSKESGWVQELEELASDPKVIAIGECGLDYSEKHGALDEAAKARQQAGFTAQLDLASKLGLPVIVHCRPSRSSSSSEAGRDAYADLLSLLQATSDKLQAVILHCYMGDTEVTEEFLRLPNVYFSFTGNITYPVKKALVDTKDDLAETVKMVPLERLFVETDCPFLAPQGKRGQRNEPANAVEVAKHVALLHGVSTDIVEQQAEANFERVFRKAGQA